ncbi:MAG: hypothetical protein WA160_05860 [Pseudobdellovibrio sp.]
MKTSQIFFTFLMLGLTACNAKLETKNDGGQIPIGPGPVGQSIDSKALNGTWSTGCLSNKGYYTLQIVTIASGNYESLSGLFSDSKCQKPVFESIMDKGTFNLIGTDIHAVLDIDFYADRENGVKQIYHNIIQYADDRFYMGDEAMASSTLNRPTKIDHNKAYIKQ